MNRRVFLKRLQRLFYAACGGVLAFPALSFVAYRKKTTRTVVFSPPEQTDYYFKQGVFLVRGDKSFTALSARCTHLGCTVRFDRHRKRFLCPCHQSVYDAAGKRLSGPARDNLQALPVRRRENGDLVVEFEA